MVYKQTTIGAYPPTQKLVNNAKSGESADEFILKLMLAVDLEDLKSARAEFARTSYEDVCRSVAVKHDLEYLDLELDDEQDRELAADGGQAN